MTGTEAKRALGGEHASYAAASSTKNVRRDAEICTRMVWTIHATCGAARKRQGLVAVVPGALLLVRVVIGRDARE